MCLFISIELGTEWKFGAFYFLFWTFVDFDFRTFRPSSLTPKVYASRSSLDLFLISTFLDKREVEKSKIFDDCQVINFNSSTFNFFFFLQEKWELVCLISTFRVPRRSKMAKIGFRTNRMFLPWGVLYVRAFNYARE